VVGCESAGEAATETTLAERRRREQRRGFIRTPWMMDAERREARTFAADHWIRVMPSEVLGCDAV
jgi:hypothetical protein